MKPYLPFLGTVVVVLLIGLIYGCVLPYNPPEIKQAQSYLVVEGSLNLSPSAISEIQLSRTQNIGEKEAPDREQRAIVRVEGDKGSSFNFREYQPGKYQLGAVSYAPNEQFRLFIKTTNGKEYRSSYVPVIKTPAIDSVTYRLLTNNEGVRISINTHDPLNNTRFYRWNFEETWEYRAPLFSGYEIINGEIKPRTEQIELCWPTRKSTKITLGSSINLSQDVIKDVPITEVTALSGKLARKYSILVTQYGLSQEEFEYWTAIAKTNESTGGLFDPQPSQVTGNITCLTDSEEIVFGFFNATTPTQQRIFITENLGRNTLADQACAPLDTLPTHEIIKQAKEAPFLVLIEFPVPGSEIPWYTTGSIACSDCRHMGATNKRPSYWR